MLHSEVPVFSAFYFGSSCSSSSGKHSISVDKNVQHNNRRWRCCGHLSWSLPTILHCPVGALLLLCPNAHWSSIIIRCYSCCFYLPTVHYSDRFHADVTKARNAHDRGRKKPVLSLAVGAASDKMTRNCVVNCTNTSGNGIRMFSIPRKKHAFAENYVKVVNEHVEGFCTTLTGYRRWVSRRTTNIK